MALRRSLWHKSERIVMNYVTLYNAKPDPKHLVGKLHFAKSINRRLYVYVHDQCISYT